MEKRYNLFNNIISIDNGDTFKNFTAKKTLPASITSRKDLFITIELEDNVKLEYISLEYYNTLNYWDILIMLNNIRDINALPKDMDTILNKVEADLKIHLDYYKIRNLLNIEDIGLEYDNTDINNPKLRNPVNHLGKDIILENARIYTLNDYKANKVFKFTKNGTVKVFEGASYNLVEPLDLIENRVPISELGLTVILSDTTVFYNNTNNDVNLIGGWSYSFIVDNKEYKIKKAVSATILANESYLVTDRIRPLNAIDDYIGLKRKELEEAAFNENEKYRTFKIIRGDKITEFLKLLDDYDAQLAKELLNVKSI